MKTGTDNPNWTNEGVVRILKNEKYCGNVILQKSYKKDLLSKRRTNNGEVRKYFVENGHEAIVAPEQFDMAQQELADSKKESRQHSAKSIFSSSLLLRSPLYRLALPSRKYGRGAAGSCRH